MPMSLDEFANLVAALPDVTEGSSYGNRAWKVGGKGFAWVRPLSKADIKRFVGVPPDGPLIGLVTEDLSDREAILALNRKGTFTIQHFQNYPAYLVDLSVASKPNIKTAVVDAWLVHAPQGLATEYLSALRRRRTKP